MLLLHFIKTKVTFLAQSDDISAREQTPFFAIAELPNTDRITSKPTLGHTMDNRVIVYQVESYACADVTRILRTAQCHPVTSRHPDPVLEYASHGTYLLDISVPKEEESLAVEALKTWEKQARPAVATHTGTFARQLTRSFFMAVLITVGIDI